MKTLGICFGATTMQCAAISKNADTVEILRTERIEHNGAPRQVLIDYLDREGRQYDRIAVTGRNFRKNVQLTGISEPEAVETAVQAEFAPEERPDLVISLGGESQLVYRVGGNGCIVSVYTGNKCASGTGEFFMQQIRRMGLDTDSIAGIAETGVPHKVAGRCSVFCKSDCTHALNKGEPVENVATGLCHMMADKVDELVKDIDYSRALIIGGGTQNTVLVNVLRDRYKKAHPPHVPDNAAVFEAYGAAVWALDNDCLPLPEVMGEVVAGNCQSFSFLPALHESAHLVEFREPEPAQALAGDACVLGLDVGSTTTKAVLLREADSRVLAKVYLRTSGNPVAASRKCYEAIWQQLAGVPVKIKGVGVTGSGRQISGLHALTDNIINEIIAHSTAATYFDPDVDTIFEIGGQDAKYTSLINGVPSDYAMNEACSAGTGSFLEEAAIESLNVTTEEIGDLAMAGGAPPNFSDQCAAFISSDINRAVHEGVSKNDILAGLVYSICMNYLNRVKGARPTGKKVFMQGGVCYNQAVPYAMASLMTSEIIVPADPGLMGAFGVALETVNRLKLGLTEAQEYDLEELIGRESKTKSSFTCAGGRDKCDRKCQISKIEINGKIYPFGGICDMYYNMRLKKKVETADLDLVAVRHRLLHEDFAPRDTQEKGRPTLGISRAFLSNTLYPLYANFFAGMGFKVIHSDGIDEAAKTRTETAFCLPVEISHGSFGNLLKHKPNFIFLPHIVQLPETDESNHSRPCVFVQSEPYYLKATFRKEIKESGTKVLSPTLNFKAGFEAGLKAMSRYFSHLGFSNNQTSAAWQKAVSIQKAFEAKLQEYGRNALRDLEANPDQFAIVLFGRSYNAHSMDANMGIPHKVASRGYKIIPHDMLPAERYHLKEGNMYWSLGRKILKAAKLVKDHPQLFGFYITNFSCGPDSFILTFFRTIMGMKPSLTLELDQHTADAGIDTRIDAAIDIMTTYSRAVREDMPETGSYTPARVIPGKKLTIVSSEGKNLELTSPQVELVFPSMGQYGTLALAATFRGVGINAKALPIATNDSLHMGRKNSSCKECLPYILTTGSFLHYLKRRQDPNKVTLLFMASADGPCRFGQYRVALEELIKKNQLKNVAVLTLSDDDGYNGLGNRILLKCWRGVVASDIFTDIRSMLRVTAEDPRAAIKHLDCLWQKCLLNLEGRTAGSFTNTLQRVAAKLKKIPLKRKPVDVPVISLIGEIFVRRDEFSHRDVVDYLHNHGFMVRTAPVHEYVYYSNLIAQSKIVGEEDYNLKSRAGMWLTGRIQRSHESKIKAILATSGLYKMEMLEVEDTIDSVEHLISKHLIGESVLTIGLAMQEILHHTCGVISIGPFGCMPSRVADSILKKEMNVAGQKRMAGAKETLNDFTDIGTLPFLAIEADGAPLPQVTEANLESFVLQAKRVQERMQAVGAR